MGTFFNQTENLSAVSFDLNHQDLLIIFQTEISFQESLTTENTPKEFWAEYCVFDSRYILLYSIMSI